MKETLKTQYFVDFSVNKQTNNFFSYFNYYQLMMFLFIIKKQKKYLIIDQC